MAVFAPSQKRDEIVRVHKYYDKNEKIHKRKFTQPDLTFSNYLSELPRNDYMDMIPDSYNANYDAYQNDLGGWENTGIPYDDLLLVKSYLESEREKQLYKSKLSELFSLLPEDLQQLSDEPGYDYTEELQDVPGYNWMGDDTYEISQPGR